jgi:hypothetical protein
MSPAAMTASARSAARAPGLKAGANAVKAHLYDLTLCSLYAPFAWLITVYF